MLGFVFRDQQRGSVSRRSTHLPGEGCQDMFLRGVVNVLRRVESQAVEMEFFNPVGRIGQKNRRPPQPPAHQSSAPCPNRWLRNPRNNSRKTIPESGPRPQMVVDNVEDYSQAMTVGLIDKATEIVRRP